MEITRRSDYACRIIRAAYEAGDSYVSVTDVAKRENIPYSFARTIQHDLVKEGILKTSRGAHGGLTLNCDPKKMTLLEILRVVQGDISVADCTDDQFFCEKKDTCTFHRLWKELDKLVSDYLEAITLDDVLTMDDDGATFTEMVSLRESARKRYGFEHAAEEPLCSSESA